MFNSDWYNSLTKPVFAPPNYVFAPAWGILYTLIGISFLIYLFTKTGTNKTKGYMLFAGQLVLNFLWSPVFFGMKNMGLALVIIVFMDILIYFNIKEFYKVSRISAFLLIPYLLWVMFATYLNAGYLYLN